MQSFVAIVVEFLLLDSEHMFALVFGLYYVILG